MDYQVFPSAGALPSLFLLHTPKKTQYFVKETFKPDYNMKNPQAAMRR